MVLWSAPGLSNVFVYDRAAILSGELWRLWTGHLVHFSVSHLVYNVIVFVVIGSLAEMQFPRFSLVCAIAATVIGPGLLLCEPDMAYYGGLSGALTAIAVSLALMQLRSRSRPRWFACALLAAVTVKIVAEFHASKPLFATMPQPNTSVCVTAHLLGAAAGALAAWLHPASPTRTVDHARSAPRHVVDCS